MKKNKKYAKLLNIIQKVLIFVLYGLILWNIVI